jgi:hypothetical protein
MSEAHEAMEMAEHAAHSAGHGGGDHKSEHKSTGKHFGLTMALVGVLISLCAALVGSQRNELTRAMIEQTEANSISTSASTKFRIIMIELEKQRGAASNTAHSGAVAASEGAMAPAGTILKRLLRLYLDYSQERSLSSSWAEAYQPLIDAHFDAAEEFERAQLIAEIGIVLASVAVLLSSRPAWLTSLCLAIVCIGMIILTSVHTNQKIGNAEQKVKRQEEAYKELRKAHTGANEDEATVEALDPGGKIRMELAPHDEAHAEKKHLMLSSKATGPSH